MGLLQWLLLSIRRAFESTLGDSDLLAPVALLRLPQLLPLDAVQLGYPFAFLGVAKPRLLRGCELPFFQRFQITVLGHALGFAAIDDGFSFPCIVRLALEEGDGSTDQAFTVCAKRFQRLFLPLVDALNLAAVDRDGRILVFFEAVHLIAVQGTDLVRLPALLLLLLRFLTLLALGDCGFRSPPDIGGERTSLILLCGDRFGLVSVFRLATELPSRALFFDNGLPVLDTPLGFFSERTPAGVPRVSFPPAGDFRRSAVPPLLSTRPFSVSRPSSVQSCGAPRVSRVPLRVRQARGTRALAPSHGRCSRRRAPDRHWP